MLELLPEVARAAAGNAKHEKKQMRRGGGGGNTSEKTANKGRPHGGVSGK